MENYPYFPSAAKKETTFPGEIRKGQRGKKVKRVQEWLSFHDFKTSTDGDFGPATNLCVKDFQNAKGIKVTGRINKTTWEALVKPMTDVLTDVNPTEGTTAAQNILAFAKQHLKLHPVEIGGQNRGPWVRMYLKGNEGKQWAWCAGFVTFVMEQAYASLGRKMPIKGSFSCDNLAHQAKQKGLFVEGSEIVTKRIKWDELPASWIFLNRKTPSDWTHTGFGFAGFDEVFRTLEGNTNDNGSRDGYEVCQRVRDNKKRDYIRLPD
ncbi:peptidoglycan-binding domain-containing protein [Zobellia laminariae]|uniref:peptidoglycan-binding domain-containing protein n=1 Tax=Zobellia laminariae TaxID=248906 RepID=UPI0012D8843A|nr:peptidoglycan-binding protein [Zobellia laminariae]